MHNLLVELYLIFKITSSVNFKYLYPTALYAKFFKQKWGLLINYLKIKKMHIHIFFIQFVMFANTEKNCEMLLNDCIKNSEYKTFMTSKYS